MPTHGPDFPQETRRASSKATNFPDYFPRCWSCDQQLPFLSPVVGPVPNNFFFFHIFKDVFVSFSPFSTIFYSNYT
jgi:hypothetical protein